MPSSKTDLQRAFNKWAARVIPLFLVGIVGYVTWVYVALLCVNFLLHPPSQQTTRTRAAIALLTIFFVLLLFMVSCYLRVIQVVLTNPGYVPLDEKTQHRRHSSRHVRRRGIDEYGRSQKEGEAPDKGYLDRAAVLDGRVPPPPGLQNFYSRDVFECDIDGLPRWCASCQIWKPDRSHHSSEIARCVYKMDHHCPWAVGIVSETNFKFFIQFCLYAAVFCLFVVISTAYFLDRGGEVSLKKVTWIVMLALAVLFMLFSAGMAINSLHMAFRNTTTIDNLALSSRTQHFAVYSPELTSTTGGYDTTSRFGIITYPLPSTPFGNSEPRTFAILASPQGTNAYRLPSMWADLRTVMGEHWYDWLLPLKYSPCCSHARGNDDNAQQGSMYAFGPALEQMRVEAGLNRDGRGASASLQSHKRRRSRKRHRQRSSRERSDRRG